MMMRYVFPLFAFAMSCVGTGNAPTIRLTIYPDSTVSDIAHKPVGINLDYFMDDGRFPNASRNTTEALRAMGMKTAIRGYGRLLSDRLSA